MRRKPAVNTATSLIKRKKKQSSKHYYKEYSKLFLNYFNKLVWILPVVEKENRNTETKISEVNETNSLKTNIKYITNGETDTFIYLLGYLNFMESCFATV